MCYIWNTCEKSKWRYQVSPELKRDINMGDCWLLLGKSYRTGRKALRRDCRKKRKSSICPKAPQCIKAQERRCLQKEWEAAARRIREAKEREFQGRGCDQSGQILFSQSREAGSKKQPSNWSTQRSLQALHVDHEHSLVEWWSRILIQGELKSDWKSGSGDILCRQLFGDT